MDDAGERVLQIFEASRQTPGTPYEPERLLAFLTDPPTDRGRMVRDTFSGRRRFVKFMEALQLELGICFTKEEWDRGYSLSQLTEGIQDELGAFPGQVRLAEHRTAAICFGQDPTQGAAAWAREQGAAATASQLVVGGDLRKRRGSLQPPSAPLVPRVGQPCRVRSGRAQSAFAA